MISNKEYNERAKKIRLNWKASTQYYNTAKAHDKGLFSEETPSWLKPATMGDDFSCTETALEIAGYLHFSKEAKIQSGVAGIVGPPGSGKSTTAREVASILGVPYLNVALSGDTIITELLGTTELVNGDTKFRPSPVAEILAYGGVLELAEINLPRPDALSALNSILDFNQVLTLPNGQVLHRHPLSFVIATINLELEGTKDLNEALKDRIQPFYQVQFPSKELLKDIVEKNLSGVNQKILKEQYGDETVLDKVVDCFLEARTSFNSEMFDLSNHMTIRWLITWTKMSEYLGSISKALYRVLPAGANFNKDAIQHVSGIATQYFGKYEGEDLNG